MKSTMRFGVSIRSMSSSGAFQTSRKTSSQLPRIRSELSTQRVTCSASGK